MVTFTVRVQMKGAEKINKRWRLLRNLPKILDPYIETIGNTIIKLAKQYAPRFEEHLVKGLNYRIDEEKNGRKLIVYNEVWWSHFQEYGFEPHFAPITPYAKRWLEAHMTGAEGVKPGKKGYFYVKKYTPHVSKAVEDIRPNIPTLLKKGVDAFLEKTFGGIE